MLKTTYRDADTAFVIRTHIAPGFMPLFQLPTTLSLARRLFRDSLTESNFTVTTGPQPRVMFSVVIPTAFNFAVDHPKKQPAPPQTAGSISGFGVGTQQWTYGATLAGLNSNLQAGIAYNFTELALQVKLGLEWGLRGLALMLTGAWENGSSEIAASVGLNADGVIMKLECACLSSEPWN